MKRTRSPFAFGCAILACAAAIACTGREPRSPGASPKRRGRIQLQPCAWSSSAAPALCGEYAVYEDRAARSGRRLRLPIVILPALEGQPLPDPIVFLAGGPGQAATSLAPHLAKGGLADLRRDRDVLFVDQRGTGINSPLVCDLTGGEPGLKPFTRALFPAELLKACAQKWDADSTLYATPNAVDDLEEIRAALGYEKLNLYGISYGTRFAQVYLRRHPQRVRTVVLEGVVAMSAAIPLPFARGSQRSLERMFEACAAEAACVKAFPRVREEFQAVLERLATAPARATLTGAGGKPESLEISRDLFATTVRSMLYFAHRSSHLPRLIHEAHQGRFEDFARRAVEIRRFHLDALGVYLAVVCADDMPFIDPAAVERETRGTFIGDYWYRQAARACAAVPHGKVAADFHEPVRSETPALLISGYHDPSTPPEMAGETARGLPNSLHVTMRHRSHGMEDADYECGDAIVTNFIRRASVAGLDTSCFSALPPTPFAPPN